MQIVQEVLASQAKVLVPSKRQQRGRGVDGSRSLALESKTSCGIQEGAGTTGDGFVLTNMAYSKISSAI